MRFNEACVTARSTVSLYLSAGMAGKFSDDDLANIDSCIPGGIQEKELDGVVCFCVPRHFRT